MLLCILVWDQTSWTTDKAFSFFFIIIIYHNLQVMIKQDSYTKANESGEEAQKETMGHIDIGLPQSKK